MVMLKVNMFYICKGIVRGFKIVNKGVYFWVDCWVDSKFFVEWVNCEILSEDMELKVCMFV